MGLSSASRPDPSELVDETRIGVEDGLIVVEVQTDDCSRALFRLHPKQAHVFSDQLLQAVAEQLRRDGARADVDVPQKRSAP